MFCKAGSRRHGKKKQPFTGFLGETKASRIIVNKTIEIPMDNCNEHRKDKKSLNMFEQVILVESNKQIQR